MDDDQYEPGTSGSKTFHVCDRRTGEVQDKMITFEGSTYDDLKECIKEEFEIGFGEDFVVTNTRRQSVGAHSRFTELQNGDTLILLESLGQEFSTPVKHKINIEPHYNTIVKSGQYDYYMSEGSDPLPYALAELIDNSLSATANNCGPRKIEVRLYLQGSSKNWMVCVLDNGKGMTSEELNDWAVLRRSKFDAKRHSQYNRKQMGEQHQHRFLNSDISFFGVGGKQACFFMGESVTVFSKAVNSPDVCEVTIAKGKFEQREKSRKQIFHEDLEQRRPGDASSHEENKNLVDLIAEEEGKDSFTHVVITGLRQENFKRVQKNKQSLCTDLANVYHYYIHGWTGNTAVKRETTSPSMNETDASSWMAEHHPVEISVTSYRDGMEHRRTKLHEIQDDFQSQFIRTAADTFEFQIKVLMKLTDNEDKPFKEEGKIEGVLRYHPFLYNKETYPAIVDEDDGDDDGDDDDGDEETASNGDPSKPARGNRPIFSCYWNGRLVPYTTIKEFQWCSSRKKDRVIPSECYNRLSGVLFTNDVFRVSTNKLTFLDLEEKIGKPNDSDVAFTTKKITGLFKRGDVDECFKKWLLKCHKELDKQTLFMEPTGGLDRNRKKWTRFRAIKWNGNTFHNGQLVRRKKKTTMDHGRIQSFLLEGEHDNDLYAAGGMFEIKLEPEAVYQGKTGLYPLSELDRTASAEEIKRCLGLEEGKLPKCLIHEWLDGHNMKRGENGKLTLQAGKDTGGFRVSIRTSDGTDISRMPSTSKGKRGKPLAVTAQLLEKRNTEEEHISFTENTEPLKGEGFVFKKLDAKYFTLGEYILRLSVTTESTTKDASPAYSFPVKDIDFRVVEGPATCFDIGDMPSSVHIRDPFPVTLNFFDKRKIPAVPPQNMQPVVTCTLAKDSQRKLKVNAGHFSREGNSLVCRDFTVIGNMALKSAKHSKVKLIFEMPEPINKEKMKEIHVEPGKPSKLRVPFFEMKPCQHENGKALKIEVLIQDEDGNLTSRENMKISCKFDGDKDVFCEAPSSDGKVTLTGRLKMNNLKEPKEITATVFAENPNFDQVNGKITIEPRKGPAMFDVFYDGIKIEKGQEITRTAGEHIDSFHFRLLDEAGRNIKVTQAIASRMYFRDKPYTELFTSGKLPPIQVEKKVDLKATYYRLHLGKEEVEVSFNFSIRSTPGPADSVRVLPGEAGPATLKCGEALNVPVEMTDEYGNRVDAKQELPHGAELSLESENGNPLCYEHLNQEEGCLIFRGIQYRNIATDSFRGTVRYKRSEAAFTVKIDPGPPAQLMAMNNDEKISTPRGVAFERNVIFRLLDEYGNVICDPKYDVAVRSSGGDLKILADSLVCEKRDSITGDYIFVGMPLDGSLGIHHILGEVQINDRHLQSKPVEVEILPNPDRPHQITIKIMKQEKYEAGEDFPSCIVTVFAENGKVMITLQRGEVTAEIKAWKGDEVKELAADEAGEGEYIFSSLTAPTNVGRYSLTFFVRHGEYMISSDKVIFDVVPGPPFQLMPMKDFPEEPSVSNTTDSCKRRIIRANTFCLMDKHNNCVDTDIRGTVRLEIAGSSQETVPLLEGETEHHLLNGCVDIPDVCIKMGCSGVNATKYTLSFIPVVPDHDVSLYERSFAFYNDVEEQEKNMKLTQEKIELQKKIKKFEMECNSRTAEMKRLQGLMQQAREKGRNLLESAGQKFENLQTCDETGKKRLEIEKAVEKISQLPRRRCRIPVYPQQDTDILGKVAHLAQVEDEREAKVLSWHLSSVMDCVVITTMQKAKEIKETNGEQGLLVLRPSRSDWERPLPHEHRRDEVPCNVVYAKHQLKFNVHVEKCKKVFHQLLGDTVIVDCIEDAEKYQEMVLRNVDCPTILTRDGCRLNEDGTFSGSLNRCPADLNGRIFSQPERSELHIMKRQIDDLQKVEKVFQELANLQTKLDERNEELKSDYIRTQEQEIKTAEARLREIERQLPKGSRKRKRQPSPESRASRSSARSLKTSRFSKRMREKSGQ